MRWFTTVAVCLWLVAAVEENSVKSSAQSQFPNNDLKETTATSATQSTLPSGDSTDTSEMFYVLKNKPPSWYYAIVIISFICTGITMKQSYSHIKMHIGASRDIGFGDVTIFPGAWGPRASRIVHLLMLPPCFCLTAVATILLPKTEALMALARTVQLSIAVFKLLELLFIILGGPDFVVNHLPQKPVKLYNAPPFCFLICKKVPDADDLSKFCTGVRQFGLIAPLVGVLQVVLQELGNTSTAGLEKVLALAMTATTLIGMASFKNLYNQLGNLMKQVLPSVGAKQMEMFLLLQTISVKLAGMLLKFLVKKGYSKGNLVIEQDELTAIYTACYICVVQVALTKFGMGAFPANSEMYPAADYETGCPLDMCSQVQLEGGRTSHWLPLAPFEHAQVAYTHLEASDSEDAGTESE